MTRLALDAGDQFGIVGVENDNAFRRAHTAPVEKGILHLPEFDLLDVGRRLRLPLRQQAAFLIRLDGDNGDATLDQWRRDFQERAH